MSIDLPTSICTQSFFQKSGLEIGGTSNRNDLISKILPITDAKFEYLEIRSTTTFTSIDACLDQLDPWIASQVLAAGSFYLPELQQTHTARKMNKKGDFTSDFRFFLKTHLGVISD